MDKLEELRQKTLIDRMMSDLKTPLGEKLCDFCPKPSVTTILRETTTDGNVHTTCYVVCETHKSLIP